MVAITSAAIKSLLLWAIQLLNIVFSAKNMTKNLIIHNNNKTLNSEVEQDWKVQEVRLKPWRENLILGLEIGVFILQATIAYQLNTEMEELRTDLFNGDIDTKVSFIIDFDRPGLELI